MVIQQHSLKFLMMDILMSETYWAHKKWNKIASDIKLVFHSSTITMMHGPINIRFNACLPPWSCRPSICPVLCIICTFPPASHYFLLIRSKTPLGHNQFVFFRTWAVAPNKSLPIFSPSSQRTIQSSNASWNPPAETDSQHSAPQYHIPLEYSYHAAPIIQARRWL